MWLFGKINKKTDEELVKAYFRSGDTVLLGHLFEQHVRTVFGTCLFYFRDKAMAKDAVMQIFEKLIVELRKSEVKNFRAWLGFVVRNHCISELRKQGRNRLLPEAYLDFEIRDPSLEEEERIARVREDLLLAYMEQALPELKENQRLCVEAFYLKARSYQQISDETGFSLNEVKSYIQNGKRNLKLLIEQRIHDEKDVA
jgi:RNA polymerase sigma factor (sigma-70 family)